MVSRGAKEHGQLELYRFLMPRLKRALDRIPRYAGRRTSASPAVGSLAMHKHRQAKLIARAFGEIKGYDMADDINQTI